MTKIAAGPRAGWNRFHGLPRPVAALLLALLVALIAFGTVESRPPARVDMAEPRLVKAEGMIGDHALYVRILRAMERGDPYYQAAAAEQRAGYYPLHPFVAMRLPTLSWALRAIGLPAGIVLTSVLALAAILAWRRRLATAPELPGYARFAVLFMAINLGHAMSGQWVLMHETLAGILLALALALYRPEKPWATMVIIAAALAVRETILPVAMLLGVFALVDRDWRAAGAWIAIGLAFAGGLALHAAAVAQVARPTDLISPGWVGLNGWANYVGFLYQTSGLRFVAPHWIAALLVPPALFGWAAWRSRIGLIVLLTHLIYAALFMLLARPDNFYWGLLVVPTLFMGLALAPTALAALLGSLLRPQAPRLNSNAAAHN